MKNHERRPDPTRDEIIVEAAKIRSEWTEQRRCEAMGVKPDAEPSPPKQYRLSMSSRKACFDHSQGICDSEYWQDTHEQA